MNIMISFLSLQLNSLVKIIIIIQFIQFNIQYHSGQVFVKSDYFSTIYLTLSFLYLQFYFLLEKEIIWLFNICLCNVHFTIQIQLSEMTIINPRITNQFNFLLSN